MDENRESRPSNKSGTSIPVSPKSENPIPTSSSSNSSPPRHKEFFPRVPNPQPSSSSNSRSNIQINSSGNSRNNIQNQSSGNSRNNIQNNSSGNSRNNIQSGGFLPASMLPHNLLRNSVANNSTTESVEQVRQVQQQQQTRFGFLLPAQQLTSESNEEERRRERRERRERMNDRWNNAANRAGFNRDDETTSINTITQMLLAMERFEQEGHGNYQEMIMRETNILFGGLHFHDEHSDMRMDIDNMSYEELLALEENIGYVSTALSKDDVAKCLKKITYHSSSSSRSSDKCSICQEEFEEGDEVGKLKCRHQYHMICIKQWLSHKNLCPVCKCSLNSN